MKKIFCFLLFFVLVLLTGCISSENTNNDYVQLYNLYFDNHELVENIYKKNDIDLACFYESGNNLADDYFSNIYRFSITYRYVVYLEYNERIPRLEPIAYELESTKKAEEVCKKYNQTVDDQYPRVNHYHNILYFEIFSSTILLGHYIEDFENDLILSNDKNTIVASLSSTENIYISSIKEIGPTAFINQKQLTNVFMSSELKKINYGAFRNCSKLTNVALNDGLLYIGSTAFEKATNLEYIIIPSSVEYIGRHAFTNTIVYCEIEYKPDAWDEYFYSHSAKVYYASEWEYDSYGKPQLINL